LVKRVAKPDSQDNNPKIKELARTLSKSNVSLGSNADEIKFISSDILTVDYVMGGKGVPRGRIIEIFGTPSSGKTTLVLQLIKNFQKNGLTCAFIDAERAFSADWAKMLGVNLENLLLCEPDSAEDTFDLIHKLIENDVDLIVVDSVAALVPEDELGVPAANKSIGLQARILSKELRKLNTKASKSKTTIIFLNQTRTKIGIMFGNPEDTPGGNALKFYASVRLRLSTKGRIKSNKTKDVIGVTSTISCAKSKVFIPFRNATVDIFYTKGISRDSGLLELAVSNGIISKVKPGIYKHDGTEFTKKDFKEKFLDNSTFRLSLFKGSEGEDGELTSGEESTTE